MWEESLPSILATVYGWFTPAVLFLLLNLVIGTIAVTSKVCAGPARARPADADDRHLSGAASPAADAKSYCSPSAIFDRLRSINLDRHRSPEIPIPLETAAAPPAHRAEILDSFVPSSGVAAAAAAAEEEHEHLQPLDRSQSDAHPTAGEIPPKLAVRIKKSASDMSAFAHFEEAEIVETRPPLPLTATPAAVGGDRAAEVGAADEVDALATNFINRFRQELKLQRLDSIMRYKEMINRGK